MTVTMQSRSCSKVAANISGQLSQKKGDLRHRKCDYPTTNDFAKVINKLLFAKPKVGVSSHFFQNIQEIGAIEGFAVSHSEEKYPFYIVRDAKCKTVDGCWLEPSCSDSLKTALERTQKKRIWSKLHPIALTKSPIFQCTAGKGVETNIHRYTPDSIPAKIKDNSSKYQDARIHFEGGNLFVLTNAEGVAKCLVGEDTFTTTHQALRLDKWFAEPSDSSSAYLNEQLIQTNYAKGTLNHDFMNGAIPGQIRSRASEIRKTLTEDVGLRTLQEMHALGNLSRLDFEKEEDKSRGLELASLYKAQLEVVRCIFAEDLHIQSENIAVIPQFAYHLDVLMTPGPAGSIFLQDYELAVEELRKIKENYTALELTERDLALLDSYIAQTSQLAKEFAELLKKAREELEKAGFVIIPTPGAFFNEKPDRERTLNEKVPFANVNFFNAITGFSLKNNRPYMMIPGTDVGDRLGGVLMDVYAEFLRAHTSPNLAVYFIGRNPKDEHDYSEAFFTTNRSASQMGPHCLSFEIETQKYSGDVSQRL